jgi:hypothetical protein
MENAQENIEELQTMGIQNKDIRQLLIGKEIYYTGNLYDKDKRKSYQVKKRENRYLQKSEWYYYNLAK